MCVSKCNEKVDHYFQAGLLERFLMNGIDRAAENARMNEQLYLLGRNAVFRGEGREQSTKKPLP